jgi:hypothetical protein
MVALAVRLQAVGGERFDALAVGAMVPAGVWR